jgi:hypothetical protein
MSYMSFEKAQRQAAEREEKRNPPVLNMSLRDHFAAKALQGFMANKSNPMLFNPEADAHYAYIIADAMIKARDVE